MPQREIRVLVVEDVAMISEMIQGVLKDIGYTVVGEARNGRQAIELTQALRPDVVLMDIEMPDMDGIEAMQHIQKSCPTPVVVLTAYETPELVQQVSAAGAGAYLVKPPHARDVEYAITITRARFDDMMELRRLNTELQTRNKELQEVLDTIKTLSGLVPICAWCGRKIRDEEGHWIQLEAYIEARTEARFSHGMCPDCQQKYFSELLE